MEVIMKTSTAYKDIVRNRSALTALLTALNSLAGTKYPFGNKTLEGLVKELETHGRIYWNKNSAKWYY
jgi:hypothetical protein